MDRRYFLKGTASGLMRTAAAKAIAATSPREDLVSSHEDDRGRARPGQEPKLRRNHG